MARKKTTRKRKSNRRRKKRSELKSWALLATGLMLGLFVALLVYLKYQTPQKPVIARPAPVTTSPATTAIRSENKETKLESKESKYGFYGSLPSSEVVVPNTTRNDSDAIVVQQAKEFSSDYSSYSIQVGSFSKASGADEQKASLNMLGYEPRIEKNRLHDGQVVHRVLLGPYPDLESANRTRTKLHSQQIDNSLLKIE